MSDSMQPHRRQPTRLPRPWDSLGKNTGVGYHFLLQCRKVKSESEVVQLSLTQRPHGLQPTRLLCPWNFPGKSTGVGCHCLLRGFNISGIFWALGIGFSSHVWDFFSHYSFKQTFCPFLFLFFRDSYNAYINFFVMFHKAQEAFFTVSHSFFLFLFD